MRPTVPVRRRARGRRCWTLGLVAAISVAPASSQAAAPPASVVYAGPKERPGSSRAAYQRLVLDLAAVWATCDEALMRRTLSADVDFSYPGRRLKGIEAAVADLKAFCAVATDRSLYFPADAFYIDAVRGRVAAEVQFRVTQGGQRQVVNDVWIVTVRAGRVAVVKEYLDGRVRLLEEDGTLTYGEDAPFLTPWPPRAEAGGR